MPAQLQLPFLTEPRCTSIPLSEPLSSPAADLCLFFVGTTSFFSPLSSVEERQRYGSYSVFPPVVEAEGMDRQDLLLPGRQLNLIQVRRGGLRAGCSPVNSAPGAPPPKTVAMLLALLRNSAQQLPTPAAECPCHTMLCTALQAVAKRTGTPIAVVLVHGAPLDVSWLQASPRVSAILSVWMPAQASAAMQGCNAALLGCSPA